LSKVIKPKNRDELVEVITQSPKVLVNFSQSSGCAPCKALLPHYEAAAGLADDTTFVYVDVLNMPEVITGFGFMRTPTLFLFENGEKVAEVESRTAMQIASEIKRK
jgi:thiol-disulfide isomerase/thioredoxin